jgi:putative membrane protein
MYAAEVSNFSLWWLFPLVMIVLCFLMMRGRKGAMMCGFGSRDDDSQRINISDSAKDILDKRYARGEIDKEEYQEKNRTLNQQN